MNEGGSLTCTPPGRFTADSISTESCLEFVSTFQRFCEIWRRAGEQLESSQISQQRQ